MERLPLVQPQSRAICDANQVTTKDLSQREVFFCTIPLMEWKQKLAQLGYQAETRFDDLRYQLHKRLGGTEKVQIVVYRGHGTSEKLYLRGRVLEDKGILPASDNDTMWDNLLSVYRRFDSDELPGTLLQIHLADQAVETVTDEEGYFFLELTPTPRLAPAHHPYTATVALLEQPEVRGVSEVIVPPANAQFGVISDVDDTILQTFATNLLKVAQLTFLHNARTRLPFPGVAAFYQALQRGARGDTSNPIFYVSSSPWNLYDLLTDFMALNEIPAGPIFLRDLGLDADKLFAKDHHTHKLEQIRHILQTHATLPFILIGDSGQQDPEIYREVVAAFPGRIAAIYIRDVSEAERDAEVAQLQQEVAGEVPLLLTADSYAAAEHAATAGFIQAEALAVIAADIGETAVIPSPTK